MPISPSVQMWMEFEAKWGAVIPLCRRHEFRVELRDLCDARFQDGAGGRDVGTDYKMGDSDASER